MIQDTVGKQNTIPALEAALRCSKRCSRSMYSTKQNK